MRLFRDILILAASVALAVVLVRTGAMTAAIEATSRVHLLESFVAGALFTTLFTIAPATAAIAQMARGGVPLAELALVGALGGMLMDFIIFRVLKTTVADHILAAVRHSRSERLKYFFRRGKTRLAGTLLGAVIVASPLPDEVGLLLMGLSRAPWYATLILTYVLNAAGIAALAVAVRSL